MRRLIIALDISTTSTGVALWDSKNNKYSCFSIQGKHLHLDPYLWFGENHIRFQPKTYLVEWISLLLPDGRINYTRGHFDQVDLVYENVGRGALGLNFELLAGRLYSMLYDYLHLSDNFNLHRVNPNTWQSFYWVGRKSRQDSKKWSIAYASQLHPDLGDINDDEADALNMLNWFMIKEKLPLK